MKLNSNDQIKGISILTKLRSLKRLHETHSPDVTTCESAVEAILAEPSPHEEAILKLLTSLPTQDLQIAVATFYLLRRELEVDKASQIPQDLSTWERDQLITRLTSLSYYFLNNCLNKQII